MACPQSADRSLLALDDPSPSAHQTRPYGQRNSPPADDPFSSSERPSISYDDFAGQGSSSRPYPLAQSASNISLGTTGTSSGAYPQPSYFDDAYTDDHNLMGTQRGRRSKRESGGGLGGFFGRVTG